MANSSSSGFQNDAEATAAAAAAKISGPKPGRLWLPRPAAHWTPRYIKNRLKLAMWQRQNPAAPWLTASAVSFLETWIKPGDVIAEFGSGRSTLYFAKKVGAAGRVVSVEHHKQWYDEVTQRLARAGAGNVRFMNPMQEEAAYVVAADAGLAGTAVDMALVDGLYRDACAIWALRVVKPSGVIAVDNVHRYLPHQTRAPFAVGVGGRPVTAKWEEFWAVVGNWRQLWTTNGIDDTAFFFKPSG